MLEITNASVCFHEGTIHERTAIHKLSLSVQKGDFISILGSNGAGKSTLLHMISGAIAMMQGSICLDGKDITRLPEYKRASTIGNLCQDPLKGTAPHMSIEENLALAYRRGKKTTFARAIKKGDRAFFIEKLRSLGLGLEERITSPVGLLSGGQRQALTLLMATLVTPKLLLLDEHIAALDPKTAQKVMQLTEQIVKEDGITTLMITHNVKQALTYGNKTIILHEGRIVNVLQGIERKNIKVNDVIDMYDVV